MVCTTNATKIRGADVGKGRSSKDKQILSKAKQAQQNVFWIYRCILNISCHLVIYVIPNTSPLANACIS